MASTQPANLGFGLTPEDVVKSQTLDCVKQLAPATAEAAKWKKNFWYAVAAAVALALLLIIIFVSVINSLKGQLNACLIGASH